MGSLNHFVENQTTIWQKIPIYNLVIKLAIDSVLTKRYTKKRNKWEMKLNGLIKDIKISDKKRYL